MTLAASQAEASFLPLARLQTRLRQVSPDALSERFDLIGLTAEVFLKTVTSALFASAKGNDRRQAIELAAGIGPLGSWLQLLAALSKRASSADAQEQIRGLAKWLTRRQGGDDWYQLSNSYFSYVLTALGKDPKPGGPGRPLDLLVRAVEVRNAAAHGVRRPGLMEPLVHAYDEAITLLLTAAPLEPLTWAYGSGAGILLLTGLQAQRAPDTSHMESGTRLLLDDATSIDLGDLLRYDADADGVFLLNDTPTRHGTAEFMNYETGERQHFPVPFARRAISSALEMGAIRRRTRRPALVPSAPAPLVGRERDVDELAAIIRLGKSRLISIVGVGGLGKTRLAMAVATECEPSFPDGVAFVDLESVKTESRLVLWLAEHFVDEVPRRGSDAAALLIDRLRPRRSLLVLDNFEHLLQWKGFLDRLVRECPGLVLLITSREPLGLPGEQRFPLRPLRLPPHATPWDELLNYSSVGLLVEKIQDFNPSFRLTEGNAEAVGRIASTIGGHPLATEIVAARLRADSLESVLANLGELMRWSRAEQGSDRQRTIATILEWSFRHLTKADQVILTRLSILPPPVPLRIAAAVAGGRMAKAKSQGAQFARLVDAGIVNFSMDGVLEIHPLVRQFGFRRLSGGNGPQAFQLWLGVLTTILREAADIAAASLSAPYSPPDESEYFEAESGHPDWSDPGYVAVERGLEPLVEQQLSLAEDFLAQTDETFCPPDIALSFIEARLYHRSWAMREPVARQMTEAITKYSGATGRTLLSAHQTATNCWFEEEGAGVPWHDHFNAALDLLKEMGDEALLLKWWDVWRDELASETPTETFVRLEALIRLPLIERLRSPKEYASAACRLAEWYFDPLLDLDPRDAEPLLTSAKEILLETGDLLGHAECVLGLAALAKQAGEFELCLRLLKEVADDSLDEANRDKWNRVRLTFAFRALLSIDDVPPEPFGSALIVSLANTAEMYAAGGAFSAAGRLVGAVRAGPWMDRVTSSDEVTQRLLVVESKVQAALGDGAALFAMDGGKALTLNDLATEVGLALPGEEGFQWPWPKLECDP